MTVFGGNAARGLPLHLGDHRVARSGRPALCWRSRRPIASPKRARPRCLPCRPACSRTRPRRLWRSSEPECKRAATWRRFVSGCTSCVRFACLEPDQTGAPRPVRRGGKNCNGVTQTRDRPGTGQDETRPRGVTAVDHTGEAVVGADISVLVTSSPTPVLENGWVKPGAHVISVGACRPEPARDGSRRSSLARLYVDSLRPRAPVEIRRRRHGDAGRPVHRRPASSPSWESSSNRAIARRGPHG